MIGVLTNFPVRRRLVSALDYRKGVIEYESGKG